MLSKEAKTQIENELDKAKTALRQGFEGRSRVHARIAAGIAVRSYFPSKGITQPLPQNTYDILCALWSYSDTPSAIKNLLEQLTRKVDASYHLPDDIDLIDATRQLVILLENEIQSMSIKNKGEQE